MTAGTSKAMIVIGIILIVLGVLALFFGGIPQEREAIQIGQASIGYTETTAIPQWLAGLGIGVGAVLMLLGFVGKK